MFLRFLKILRQSDWVLTFTLILLLLLSLAALYASGKSSEAAYSNFIQQTLFIIVGLILYFTLSSLDFRKYRSYGVIFFIVAALLLVAVLFFGSTIRNTTGWFRIGDYGIQPVEFVKVLWIVAMAWLLTERGQKMNEWKNIAFLGGAMLILVILIMLQPDLGSALVLIATTLGLLFITNVKRSYIAGLFLAIVVLTVVSWFFILQDYQKERILVLFDPERDPLGRGYHVTQSIIAIGSGGWLGRGLGFGSQSQLQFLPEQQTDFIFAVLAEELGFLGAGLVIVLYGVMLYRCIRTAWTSRDAFGTFVSYGCMLLIFFHVLINIGMNVGVVPVAGISLPFVSYGGSALLAMMMALGIVQSIHVHQKISP